MSKSTQPQPDQQIPLDDQCVQTDTVNHDGNEGEKSAGGEEELSQPGGTKTTTKRPYRKRTDLDRLQAEREKVTARQRRDVKRLSRELDDILARKDKGAGSAGVAAAYGQLIRAGQTLHNMEADVYGLRKADRMAQAVIVIPGAVSMEDWQAQADAQLAGTGTDGPSEPLRLVEDDIIGAPGSDGVDE